MKKTYNVVFQTNISDLDIASKLYFYDWGTIPDVPYYVSFVMSTATTGLITNLSTVSLYVDLAQTTNKIATSLSSPTNKRGQFLGNIKNSGGGLFRTQALLLADTTSNPKTYLSGRPANNFFMIEILENQTTPYADIEAYSLILSFTEA